MAAGRGEAIAVIGMAFEFPGGATSEDSFWEMIRAGRSASTGFPSDRLNIDAFYDSDDRRSTGMFTARGGNFVSEKLDVFDAPFFSITPNEAACMDPQHRRMLETAYHAFEDAGITLDQCAGTDTSVYTGCFTNDYASILQQDYESEQKHAALGAVPTMLANRLSWFFNLRGASLNVDTACSSSLVAFHLACQDLRSRTSSMALVGGANLVYHPNFMRFMSDFNFLSPDSQSWSFDEKANGYARGEGLAVITLKRLDDALRDGNTIRAIVRGTGSNQDGRTPGITQPSGSAQVNLIRKTYAEYNISMQLTRYFEAHGTGTPTGDPIEGNAIGEAFKDYRTSDDPLYIGAVKANIGHLEGCSGLAGLIKTILVLESGHIPPIAGFQTLNKAINAGELNLHFPKENLYWPEAETRRACVNSFGFGGTNALAILDDAYNYLRIHGLEGHHRTKPDKILSRKGFGQELLNGGPRLHEKQKIILGHHHYVSGGQSIELSGTIEPDDAGSNPLGLVQNAWQSRKCPARLLVFSAPDQKGARRLTAAYQSYLSTKQEVHDIDNLAYSLIVSRTKFPWRSFALLGDGCATMPGDTEIKFSAPSKVSNNPQIAFVFTGQGAQYLGMGRDLLEYDAFQKSIEESETYLRELGCPWSLLEALSCQDPNSYDIESPEYSQTLTTCLQMALTDFFRNVGITPSFVLGHSSGEIAAAYASGALSRRSAVRVAYHRGALSSRLAANLTGLTMMAVGISRSAVEGYLQKLSGSAGSAEVQIGCVNSPTSVTLTGNSEQLSTLERWFHDDGVFCRKLRVPVAYHSRFMESISSEYARAIKHLEAEECSGFTPMISSVTGDIISAHDLTSAEYWTRNLTSTVEFEAALRKLLAFINRKPKRNLGGKRGLAASSNVTHILEVGPHRALQGPILDTLKAFGGADVLSKYQHSLVRGQKGNVSLLNTIGALHCSGFSINLLAAQGLNRTHRPLDPRLPKYPFNHTQGYWLESSLDQNFRFRGAPRHVLLGSRSLDWNIQIAQWRNLMRLSELPWLQDHKIGSEIVFPAAGMLAMAIEAVRQVIGDTLSNYGVQIRHATFSHAISIPQGKNTIETQLTLIQSPTSSKTTPWSQFRLFCREEGSYIECASGFIRAVMAGNESDTVFSSWSGSHKGATPEEWSRSIAIACGSHREEPLDLPVEAKVHYGPAFQNLEWVRLGSKGQLVAQVNTETWKVRGTDSPTPSFAIHPATLDGLAQCMGQALLAQRPNDLPTMVPVRVANMWLDCDTEHLRQGKIEVAAKANFHSHRGCYADIVAIADAMNDSKKSLIYMEGLETAFIESNGDNTLEPRKPRQLCRRLTWKPDIDSMSTEQLLSYCNHDRPQQEENAPANYESLALVIHCFIEEALEYLKNHPTTQLKDQRSEAYVEWMRYQQHRLRTGDSVPKVSSESVLQLLRSPSSRSALQERIENHTADGFFFIPIGRSLIKMISSEVDPLEFIFRDGLADRYYEKMLASEHHSYPASRYIELMCFKNPNMRILEVGAGTGGQTKGLLDSMSRDGVKRWAQYDFTDISPSFFNHAREKFRDYIGKMNFRVFNVSDSPEDQKFELGSYDLVIASHVLHATDRLDGSLRNIRSLLKTGGKLLLFETTRPESVPIGFAWGLLKGWWCPLNYESRSPHSPCVTSKQWHEVLRNTGFSGVDVEIPGQTSPSCQFSSILISTAETQTQSAPREIETYVVIQPNSEPQVRLAEELMLPWNGTASLPTTICTISELAGIEKLRSQSLVIFLVEVHAMFLDGISESDYRSLQKVLSNGNDVLWVTRSTSSGAMNPAHHLSEGLGRTLMSEDSTRKFVCLRLIGIENSEDLDQVTETIRKTAIRIVDLSPELLETSYRTNQGGLEISRITNDADMNSEVAANSISSRLRPVRLSADTPLSLQRSPGRLPAIEWAHDAEGAMVATQDIGQDELIVHVRAIGINSKELFASEGYNSDTSLSMECAGLVARAGARTGFEVGDRVCLISPSAAKSIIRVQAQCAFKMPPGMSFLEASCLPVSQWVAYHALVNLSRVREDNVVLVHDDSSGIGQMIVQLAKAMGAHVLAIARSAEEAVFLSDSCSVASTDVFTNGDTAIHNRIMESTKGSGVDVYIRAFLDDKESNAMFTGILPSLSPGGRLVDICTQASPNMRATGTFRDIPSNVSYVSVSLKSLMEDRPLFTYKTFQEAMSKALSGRFRSPQPLREIPATDIDAGPAWRQPADTMGRTVVTLDPGTSVMARFAVQSAHKFPSNATYVICGAFGGLGRSIVRWIVSQGARNLILLSRSGGKSEEAKALISELDQQAVQVAAPPLDVGDMDQLTAVFEELMKVMPPVRGCIQAAMALRDNLFPNMMYRDWITGIQSKATGSYNLHLALPHGLDFFVMLASVYGVFGGPGQANYSAANAFQDALARHRISLGEKAVSLDLGMMVSDGYVAENADVLGRQRRFGQFMEIKRVEFLALLNYYCDRGLPLLSPDQSQVLVGFETAAAIRAKRIDIHHALYRPLFRELFISQDDEHSQFKLSLSTVQDAGADNSTLLRQAASDEEAGALVTNWFRLKIAQVLGVEVDEAEASRPAHTYGIDSLVAIDLKNWFEKDVGADMQVFHLLGNKPLGELAKDAARASRFRSSAV